MAFKEKLLTTAPAIEVAGRSIKRYFVTDDPAGIDPKIEEAAFAMLPKLLPSEPDPTPPATFTVLHQGYDGGVYLDAFSWVWVNVLHMRFAAAAQPALDCPDDDPTHFVVIDRPWIGCVYEFPPIQHERDAWVRHMLVPDQPDLTAYLADVMADGTTGGRG